MVTGFHIFIPILVHPFIYLFYCVRIGCCCWVCIMNALNLRRPCFQPFSPLFYVMFPHYRRCWSICVSRLARNLNLVFLLFDTLSHIQMTDRGFALVWVKWWPVLVRVSCWVSWMISSLLSGQPYVIGMLFVFVHLLILLVIVFIFYWTRHSDFFFNFS